MQSVDTDNMSNKRKAGDAPDADADVKAKRQRRRRRSRSEPRNTGSGNAQRRETLRRLFGRYCLHDNPDFDSEDDYLTEGDDYDEPFYVEDPLLLDAVPECMDPEQLGFLLCAQETLRFLRQSGMSFRNPVYVSLRGRFVKALIDLGIA